MLLRNLAVLFLIAGFIFSGCDQQQQKEKEKEDDAISEEFKEIEKESRDLIDDIENASYEEKGKLEVRMENFVDKVETKLGKSEREGLDAETNKIMNNLEEQKNKIENDLEDFKNATEDNWENVKSDIKSDFQKFQVKVKELFE
ncbi:MAG: hypothetical protein ACLFUC_03915 [Bacteroidales bacterium]